MTDASPSHRSSSSSSSSSLAWRRAGVLLAVGLLAASALTLRFSRAFGWLHGSLVGGSSSGSSGGAAPAAPSVRYNYAAASCGAKVVWTKSLLGSGSGGGGGVLVAHAPAVLDGAADRYLYAVCSHCGTQYTGAAPGCFWFVVELCQAIKVDAVALQTTELFAAYPKDFAVQGSFTFVSPPFPFIPTFRWQCLSCVLLCVCFQCAAQRRVGDAGQLQRAPAAGEAGLPGRADVVPLRALRRALALGHRGPLRRLGCRRLRQLAHRGPRLVGPAFVPSPSFPTAPTASFSFTHTPTQAR